MIMFCGAQLAQLVKRSSAWHGMLYTYLLHALSFDLQLAASAVHLQSLSQQLLMTFLLVCALVYSYICQFY